MESHLKSFINYYVGGTYDLIQDQWFNRRMWDSEKDVIIYGYDVL